MCLDPYSTKTCPSGVRYKPVAGLARRENLAMPISLPFAFDCNLHSNRSASLARGRRAGARLPGPLQVTPTRHAARPPKSTNADRENSCPQPDSVHNGAALGTAGIDRLGDPAEAGPGTALPAEMRRATFSKSKETDCESPGPIAASDTTGARRPGSERLFAAGSVRLRHGVACKTSIAPLARNGGGSAARSRRASVAIY
jgi:hypothetical protein